MNKIYKIFGGRKMYYFNFIFIVNVILVMINRWVDGFGWFSIGLYGTIVLGIEGNKFIRGRNDKSIVE
jgi:hypothetical protein